MKLQAQNLQMRFLAHARGRRGTTADRDIICENHFTSSKYDLLLFASILYTNITLFQIYIYFVVDKTLMNFTFKAIIQRHQALKSPSVRELTPELLQIVVKIDVL